MQLEAWHMPTPMQWDNTTGLFSNASFCKENVKPWMRVSGDYPRVSVQEWFEIPPSGFPYRNCCIDFRKSKKGVYDHLRMTGMKNAAQADRALLTSGDQPWRDKIRR